MKQDPANAMPRYLTLKKQECCTIGEDEDGSRLVAQISEVCVEGICRSAGTHRNVDGSYSNIISQELNDLYELVSAIECVPVTRRCGQKQN